MDNYDKCWVELSGQFCPRIHVSASKQVEPLFLKILRFYLQFFVLNTITLHFLKLHTINKKVYFNCIPRNTKLSLEINAWESVGA